MLAIPAWIGGAVDGLVIGLLLLVGVLNMRALTNGSQYRATGWRQGLIPRALRDTSHPLAIVAVEMIFGLVFDTTTQAAALGTAASLGGGVQGAIMVAAAFAAGMVLTDTADSQIVARLLRAKGDPERVRRYRRGVGWLIVALSLGMAAYALAAMLSANVGLADNLFTAVGLTMALAVIGALAVSRQRQRIA